MENKRALILSSTLAERAEWREALLAAGWEVEEVEQRAAVLERIPEFLPSLLVLDFGRQMLPGEVEESFAQRCRDSGLAVIVILRDPTPVEVAVAFRRGAIDVLISPFDIKMLLAAVARAGAANRRKDC